MVPVCFFATSILSFTCLGFRFDSGCLDPASHSGLALRFQRFFGALADGTEREVVSSGSCVVLSSLLFYLFSLAYSTNHGGSFGLCLLRCTPGSCVGSRDSLTARQGVGIAQNEAPFFCSKGPRGMLCLKSISANQTKASPHQDYFREPRGSKHIPTLELQ